jgi:ABC-type glycerol-3-phosphate transport system substrate-binding protein
MTYNSNMKFKRKIFRATAVVLILSILAGGLSGCIAKEKTASTGKGQKVQLVYYKLFDEEDIMTPMIQQYTTKHTNVQIIYKKFTDPVEFENLIINELAEGEGPDIFSAPNYWFLRNAKKISPMPDSKMTVAQFEDTFVSVAKNDLVLRDAADGKTKIYGIPLTVDTLALYYNKGTFDDKIPSRGRPAETWEELKEDVFKLTKKDQSFERFELSGIAMGRSDNIARAVDILYLLMLQYKTKFYNENVSQAQFANQTAISGTGVSLRPSVEAMQLYTSFALPANKNYAWNQYLADAKSSVKEMDTFARGKVAMIFGYSYLYEQILSQIKDLKGKGVQTMDEKNVRIAAVPQVIDPKVSTEKRIAYASYYAETVSRTSKNPDVAWDFLLFMSGKDNLKYYNEKTHKPTSRRDMIDDQIKDPIYGVFAEQIGYAESFPIYDSARYAQIFAKAIDSVLATQSVSDVLRIAENSINAMLPKEGMIPPAPKEETTADAKKTSTKTGKTTQQ